MTRIRWSKTARQSLIDVAENVIEQSQSLETGLKLIDAIEEKCRTYADFPQAGIPRDDLRKGLRCFVVGKHIVIYRPIDGGMRVVLVAHGHQDLYALMHRLSESE